MSHLPTLAGAPTRNGFRELRNRPALQTIAGSADPRPSATKPPRPPVPSQHFASDNPHLAVWLRNEATDAIATKAFKGRGGFKGTAINPTYVKKRLTAEFGPIGEGWGVEILSEDVLTCAPVYAGNGALLGHELLYRVTVSFWWINPATKQRAAFPAVGNTMLVMWRRPNSERETGQFETDEEAPKKSLTDAITKAASCLGFGADVHLGLWDTAQYVAQRAAEQESHPTAKRTWRQVTDELRIAITRAATAAELDMVAASPDAELVRTKASQPLRDEIAGLLAEARGCFAPKREAA